MSRRRTLRRDESGAASMEMAFAVPVLAVFLWGIFQVGVAFQAVAGMQHALGQGARLATIYPTPSNTAIKARINESVFGVGIGEFEEPAVTDGPSGSNYKDLSVSFSMTTSFLLFEGPDIELTRSKRVYTYIPSAS
jgi:hypothetical protein